MAEPRDNDPDRKESGMPEAPVQPETDPVVQGQDESGDAVAAETPAPETAAPETPAPETPAPETAAPEAPASETPAPETPVAETPVPETTNPEIPAPAAPAPTASTPVRPRLRDAGVRTSSPAPPSSKKGRQPATKEGAVATEETEGEEGKSFDPATDLPMYREGMDWFVLRVASNKENFVKETLLRKVQIEALENRVGRIMVPTEKTKTLKGGKTRITETKLYPGYIFVEMRLEPDGRIPQDVFFLIKETTGVGDFVGTAGRPTPMSPNEVEKMLFDSRRPEETPSVKMEFAPGDYVIITEGPFESYEGTVDEVLPEKGLVRVLVTIFGRQAPIELEYWQIQKGDA
jgi:transcriptional antiterminator NusG